MHLLSLFDVCVKLGDTAKCELVHEIDTVGVGNEFLTKRLDCDRKGSAKQADLMVLVTEVDNLFQNRLELRGQKFVCFVHNNGFHFTQISNFFGCKVKNASGCCNYNVNGVVKTHYIIF